MFEGVGNDDRTIGSGSHVSAGHTPDIYAEDSTTEDGSVDDASGSKRDCPKATSRCMFFARNALLRSKMPSLW